MTAKTATHHALDLPSVEAWTKEEVLRELGPRVKDAAECLGISQSALSQWPVILKRHHIQVVEAALYRRARTGTSVRSAEPEGTADAHDGMTHERDA
jgi:predicted transcriptional regulator